MFSDFSQYYYSDWIAFMMTIFWIYYNGEKKKVAFLFAILSSISWLIMGYLTHSIASIIANATFIVLNIHALNKWNKN